MTNDLKLNNIQVGLTEGGLPAHGCYASEWDRRKPLEPGVLRTKGTCKEDYKEFRVVYRSNSAYASKVNNQINEPLVSGEDHTVILDKLAIPELHEMEGIVNHINEKLEKFYSQGMDQFYKHINVHKTDQHASKFAGNSSKKIIDNADKLSLYLEPGLTPFVELLFSKVVNATFSSVLDPDYEQIIKNFNKSYMILHCDFNLSITTKVHIIMCHLSAFVKEWKIGLGLLSEQTGESLHHDFKRAIIAEILKVQTTKHTSSSQSYPTMGKTLLIFLSSNVILGI